MSTLEDLAKKAIIYAKAAKEFSDAASAYADEVCNDWNPATNGNFRHVCKIIDDEVAANDAALHASKVATRLARAANISYIDTYDNKYAGDNDYAELDIEFNSDDD